MGHVTLWCGTYSAENHRNTRFYERPPQQVRPQLDDAAGRLSASETTARATVTATGRSAVNRDKAEDVLVGDHDGLQGSDVCDNADSGHSSLLLPPPSTARHATPRTASSYRSAI